MKVEIEFLYHAEIRRPSKRACGGYLAPTRQALFGRHEVEIDRFGVRDLPLAYRLRHLRWGSHPAFLSDGSCTLESFEARTDELFGWFRAYSRRHTLDAIALRRWFGDGKGWRGEVMPLPEEQFVPERGCLVSDDRDAALARMLEAASRMVLVGREVWMRQGFGVLTVLPPGSVVIGPKSVAKAVMSPRLEYDTYWPDDARAWRIAEYAGRDLLFYPDEEVQARSRAADFGKRLSADWEVMEAPDLSCYPDLSALSMSSWVVLLKRQLGGGRGDAPFTVPDRRPEEPTGSVGVAMPETVAAAVAVFSAKASAGASSHAMLAEFSAIGAAFGATVETSALTRRRDIAGLLDMHGRIVRRVEMRPDRRAAARLAAADEKAIEAMADGMASGPVRQ